ncbi:hypothetical protein acdb102_30730 [Acidothermaceae bacterium B102]|nr:hypothetical protein acdb102_30730 [Acidothermaceae bacterium B102]
MAAAPVVAAAPLVAAADVAAAAPVVAAAAPVVAVVVPECTEDDEQALRPAKVAAPSEPVRKSRREAAMWLSLRSVLRSVNPNESGL